MKNRRRHIKKLDYFLKNTNQFTLNNILSGRMYHAKDGWINFSISYELRKKIAELISSSVGGNNNTKNRIKNNILRHHKSIKNFGILGRLILENYNNICSFNYCAGQDYNSEIKTVRNILKA